MRICFNSVSHKVPACSVVASSVDTITRLVQIGIVDTVFVSFTSIEHAQLADWLDRHLSFRDKVSVVNTDDL